MKLSDLQKYILLQIYSENGKFNRSKLLEYYKKDEKGPKEEEQSEYYYKVARTIDGSGASFRLWDQDSKKMVYKRSEAHG